MTATATIDTPDLDTSDTAEREPVHRTVRARDAALAWLNAFLAAGQDDDRPGLYRTMAIEVFDGGLQFVCCDATALFRTFAPAIADEEHPGGHRWPSDYALPRRTVVVMDPDGFGLAFMRALLAVTKDDAHAFEPLTVTTSPMDDGATLALGAEFQTERLTLRACGQRIDLRLYDGPYPADYRTFRLGVDERERVDGVAIATRLYAMVGKLKSVNRVEMEFAGDKRVVQFTATELGGDAEVRGFLAPMLRAKEPTD